MKEEQVRREARAWYYARSAAWVMAVVVARAALSGHRLASIALQVLVGGIAYAVYRSRFLAFDEASKFSARSVGLAVLAGVLGSVVTAQLAGMFMHVRPSPPLAMSTFDMIWAVTAVPFAEESLFRGVILNDGRMSQARAPSSAVLFSALLFAAYHVEPNNMVWLTIAGCTIGWVYLQTRSLPCAMLTHASWNATSLFLLALN